MEKKMKRFLGLISVSMITSLIMVTPVVAAPPNVINWAVMGDYSGPYAASVGPIRIGALHAVEYVNARGGIAGVKVNPLIYDNGGKVDITIGQFADAMTKKPKPLFASYYYSAIGEALHDRFVEEQLPVLGSASIESIYPRGTVFAQYPMYGDMFGGFCDWLVKQSKEPVKLGILTANTTYGKQITYPETTEYAKSKGIDVVGVELFGPRDIDMTTQLVKLRNAGANWVISNYTGMPIIAILRNIKELGWKVNYCSGYSESGQFLIDPGISVGAYFFRERKPLGGPESKFMLDVAKGKGTPLADSVAFYTLAWADLFHAKLVIEKIVKDKGWDAVNPKSILAEILRYSGPLMNGYTYREYTRDVYSPSKFQMMKWVAKTNEEIRETEGFVSVSDWITSPDIFKNHPLRKRAPMYAIP